MKSTFESESVNFNFGGIGAKQCLNIMSDSDEHSELKGRFRTYSFDPEADFLDFPQIQPAEKKIKSQVVLPAQLLGEPMKLGMVTQDY
jgi:hypothetical protein